MALYWPSRPQMAPFGLLGCGNSARVRATASTISTERRRRCTGRAVIVAAAMGERRCSVYGGPEVVSGTSHRWPMMEPVQDGHQVQLSWITMVPLACIAVCVRACIMNVDPGTWLTNLNAYVCERSVAYNGLADRPTNVKKVHVNNNKTYLDSRRF